MTHFCSEMAEMAAAMRNFLEAVDGRRELTVEDAMKMLDAWHGSEAALMAMSHADVAMAEDDLSDAAFWMQVYHTLLEPTGGHVVRVTLH